jgi:hypothetical protein
VRQWCAKAGERTHGRACPWDRTPYSRIDDRADEHEIEAAIDTSAQSRKARRVATGSTSAATRSARTSTRSQLATRIGAGTLPRGTARPVAKCGNYDKADQDEPDGLRFVSVLSRTEITDT